MKKEDLRYALILKNAVVCLSVLVSLLETAFSQKITGTLTGNITDQSGAAVAGAKVAARNELTNVERETFSNDRGSYAIQFLAPGAYDVSIEQQGFKRPTYKKVVVQVDQTASLDVKLEVGELVQEVEVEAAAPLLQTGESSIGSVIEQKQVQELPLNGRQFLQLALLVPGVVAGPLGGAAQAQRGALSTLTTINVNGNREGSNLFLIDGTLNTDPNYNTFVISPNVDSILEFKVQTSSYSAEFGQQAGGQINLVTRGGSNKFHGAAYEFLRNSALDAKNLFDLPSPAKIPPFRQNQFGATFGGPVWKDKTFFFGSYEGFRQVKAQTLVAVVPDGATRRGDFSNHRDSAGNLIPIYDPAKTRPNPSFNSSLPASQSNPQYLRDPFPGSIIPADRIDPIATGILSYVDLPNLGPLPLGQGRFLNNESQRQNTDQLSVRLDHSPSTKDQLFGRYSFSDEFLFAPGALLSQGTRREPRPQIFTLGHTRFFSPSTANESRLGFTRFRIFIVDKNAFTENIPAKLGINGQAGLSPLNYSVPFVGFGLEGLTSFGSNVNATSARNNIFQFADTLTTSKGSHTFRMGLQWFHFQLNNSSEIGNVPNYTLRATPYTADITNPTGVGRGNSFADFLLGISHVNQVGSGSSQIYLRRDLIAPWFEDTWKITPDLTLNLGIRWDFSSPLIEKDDRIGGIFVPAFNGPAQPIPLQAGKNVSGYGQVPRGIINTDKNNFAPRIGIAYRMGGSDKTVIRAGYGLFYDTQIGNTTVDFVRNPPFRVRIIASAPDSIFPFLTLKDLVPPNVTIAQSYFGQGQEKDGRVDWPTAYVQQWNLSLQREILPNWAVTSSYVGSTARHLSVSAVANLPYPGPGARGPRRPFFSTLGETIFQHALPRTNSYYHALQIWSEHRSFHGLTMLNSYTFSKSIDTGQEIRAGGASITQFINNYDIDRENRGRSNFDQRHRFVSSFLYDLPFGSGKRYLNYSKAIGHVLGNWQMNGIITISTGFPFTVYSGVDTANTGLGGLTHASSVPGVDPTPAVQSADRWFDPTAFGPAPNCANAAVFGSLRDPSVCYGSAGRNILNAPGLSNFDFSLLKTIPIGEAGAFQFRTEIFNVFNTPPLGFPLSTLTNSAVGRILTAGTSRQIQFSLRYSF